MDANVLTAIVGGISSVLGASVGWIFGRRKHRAEASILEAESLDSIREFYEKLLKDNLQKLDYYIQLSEDNRKELHSLRLIIDKLIQDACLRKGCSMRVYYDTTDLEHLLDRGEHTNKKEEENKK